MVNKKSITPVVAIALLLVIAVLSVVGFENWYKHYQSSLESNMDEYSLYSISMPYLSSDYLYIKNNNKVPVNFTDIVIDNVDCHVNGTIPPEMTVPFNVSSCMKNTSNTLMKKVILLTSKGAISKTMIVNSAKFVPVIRNTSTVSSGKIVGYAYGENFGYVSFNGSNYGVSIVNNKLVGYAYSENLGYISFNGTNYSVEIVNGKLEGYAYGENFGYISFNGTDYGVTFDGKYFYGEAYSPVEGYLYFNYSTLYNVSVE